MFRLLPDNFLTTLFFVCFSSILLSYSVNAQSALIEKAYRAYEKKNQSQLNRAVQQLKARNDSLAPYAEYWQVKRTLKQTSAAAIQRLLQRTQDYAFHQNLKALYLSKLGKSGQWRQLLIEAKSYQGKSIGVQCLTLEARARLQGAIDRSAVSALWHYQKRRPSDCNGLFRLMQSKQVINNKQLHERIRMAALSNQLRLAKELSRKLPKVTRKVTRLFDRARKSPKRFLTKRVASFHKPLGVTLNLYALDRLARKNPQSAANVLRSIQHHFSKQARMDAWEVVAYRAARNVHTQALNYYKQAYHFSALPDYLQHNAFYIERQAWKARAALRAQQWPTLLSTIAQMPKEQQTRARWRYWKARGLKAAYANQPQRVLIADGLLTTLAQERHYYGWLAAEELQKAKLGYYQPTQTVDETLVKAIASEQKIQRAVALHRAGVHSPARKAWYAAIKHYSDQEFLAASVYAKRLGWHDVSINTADRTKLTHDFNLRYPKPFAKHFKVAAASEGLDASWVFGLVRQESRFIDYAKSRVGAAGLMQLMPKTARWAAKKKGMRRYKRSMIDDVSTNISLGTYYMRYTLDLLGGNAVLATAGYNAGPSRALKWMANKPLEGAIYIETIPFNETRNYVQRVMANAHFYETRAGVPTRTIKQRIGIIPAKHK